MLLPAILLSGSKITDENIENYLCSSIKSAKHSLLIYTHLLSSENILEILNSKAEKTEIKIILPKSSTEKSYSVHWTLSENIILMTLPDSLASGPDFIVIDSSEALLGHFYLQPEKYNKDDFCIQMQKSDIKDIISRFRHMETKADITESGLLKMSIEDFNKSPDEYTGRFCEIGGIVRDVRVSKDKKTYFIDFENDKTGFTIVIFESVSKQLLESNINPLYWKGKYKYFKGLIINHEKYGYEIILNSLFNVK